MSRIRRMNRQIIKGGKEYVAMEVRRRNNLPFALSGATYKVLDPHLNEIGDEGIATIDEPAVLARIDTSKEAYLPGRLYHVEFAVEIEGLDKLLKDRVQVFVSK